GGGRVAGRQGVEKGRDLGHRAIPVECPPLLPHTPRETADRKVPPGFVRTRAARAPRRPCRSRNGEDRTPPEGDRARQGRSVGTPFPPEELANVPVEQL